MIPLPDLEHSSQKIFLARESLLLETKMKLNIDCLADN